MPKPIDVILLSGGKGTRFREITHDKVPKPLYKINDIELIKYSIASLDFSLVNNLIFAIDHHAAAIREWVDEQDFPGNVILSYQDEPGVYGAVKNAMEHVTADSFLISNTDEVREDLLLKDLLAAHELSSRTLATMALAPARHLYRHRVISTDADNIIVKNDLLNERYRLYPNLEKMVNAGYVLYRREAASYFDGPGYNNGWSAMVNPLIEKGLMRGVSYPDVTYFNVGTPAELDDALNYFKQKACK